MPRKEKSMIIGYPRTWMVNTQNGQKLSPSNLLLFQQFSSGGSGGWLWFEEPTSFFLRIDLFLLKTSKQCHIWNIWSNFWGKFYSRNKRWTWMNSCNHCGAHPLRRKQRWSFSPGYSFVEEGQRIHQWTDGKPSFSRVEVVAANQRMQSLVFGFHRHQAMRLYAPFHRADILICKHLKDDRRLSRLLLVSGTDFWPWHVSKRQETGSLDASSACPSPTAVFVLSLFLL